MGSKIIRSSLLIFSGLIVSLLTLISCVNPNSGLIMDVVTSPVVSNGLVAGEPTDINILLTSKNTPNSLAFDWTKFGRQIPSGGRMEVEFEGTFERNGVDNTQPYVDVNNNQTFILGTGHPQNPIVESNGTGVQHGNYIVKDLGYKVISVIPNGGINTNGLANTRASQLGMKVIHVRPNTTGNLAPFRNGPAGTIGIVKVSIMDAADRVVASGLHRVEFLPKTETGPHIAINNEGFATLLQSSPNTTTVELVESIDFQHVPPSSALLNRVPTKPLGQGAPYALQFILIDAPSTQPDSFMPMKGIAGVGYLPDTASQSRAKIMKDTNLNGGIEEGDSEIGIVTITGPAPAKILSFNSSLTTSGDGITGPNGSILKLPVQVGSKKGVYKVKATLYGGSTSIATIIVE